MNYQDYENWGHFNKLKIKKGWKALDIGCGDGLEVFYLRSLGVDACGMDNGSWGYPFLKENFFIGDARFIPCKDEYFDLVLCLVTLQHIPEDKVVIQEINRVLKKEGKIIITVLNKFGITLKWLRITIRNLFGLKTGYAYFKAYTKRELMQLLEESGFQIQESYTTRFIPYRLRKKRFGEVLIGILFWFERNILSKMPVIKDMGSKIVIIAEKI